MTGDDTTPDGEWASTAGVQIRSVSQVLLHHPSLPCESSYSLAVSTHVTPQPPEQPYPSPFVCLLPSCSFPPPTHASSHPPYFTQPGSDPSP